MSALDYIVGIILAGIGCALFTFLFWGVFGPALRIFTATYSKHRLNSASQKLRQADDLIAAQKWNEAVNELCRAVILDTYLRPKEINAVSEHHQNILSRLLVISEETSTRVDNIAELEKLFLQRTELQTLYLKAENAFFRLQSKRVEAGKGVPTWSKSDFETRRREIKAQLHSNKECLLTELGRLQGLTRNSPDPSVMYH